MYKLSDTYIEKNLKTLLCSYNDTSSYQIMSNPNFTPQTFTVADKMGKKKLIHFNEIGYADWLIGIVDDQIKDISDTTNQDTLKSAVLQNISIFLQFKIGENPLSNYIYNQEFVDIIRRIIYFTIYGNNNSELCTAFYFNSLAYRLFPSVLDLVKKRKYDEKSIFKLSVASGLIGLDMKGAPAASSNYTNGGIPIKKYQNVETSQAAVELLNSLENVINHSPTPVFYWDEFKNKILNGGKLVWMTDDYIESFFDLYFIMILLQRQPDLHVEIIPKNGIFGNDLSYNDANKIIRLPIFSDLLRFNQAGRFKINQHGPQMGAANIKKLSSDNVQSILNSDIFLAKGCRIHEMLQGGLNREVFSSYIVTRELSEIVTGYNSKETPILLLNLKPGEYAFWGVSYKNSKETCLSDGRTIRTSASTLRDHENRKNLSEIEDIVSEFNALKKLSSSYEGDLMPIFCELEMLSTKISECVVQIYRKLYKEFANIHFGKTTEINQLTWEKFNEVVAQYFHKSPSELTVLDAATGSGRDLVLGSEYGYNMEGCDNCREFIDHFNCSKFSSFGCYSYGNLMQLPYADGYFDIVRQNASIVHIPLIAKGYSADLALEESYRVLKRNGLLYILVKKGDGLEIRDTNDGMGIRPFQFYTTDTLEQLLQRNHFSLSYIEELIEYRDEEKIAWLLAFANKTD